MFVPPVKLTSSLMSCNRGSRVALGCFCADLLAEFVAKGLARQPSEGQTASPIKTQKTEARSVSLCLVLSPEHVCSIIASMLRNLKSQQRSRLLNKFTENDCEKVCLIVCPVCCFSRCQLAATEVELGGQVFVCLPTLI